MHDEAGLQGRESTAARLHRRLGSDITTLLPLSPLRNLLLHFCFLLFADMLLLVSMLTTESNCILSPSVSQQSLCVLLLSFPILPLFLLLQTWLCRWWCRSSRPS